MEKTTLTCSPFSEVIEENVLDEIAIPDDFVIDSDQKRICITEVKKVGLLNPFSSCKVCKRKVKDRSIRKASQTLAEVL